MIMAFMPAQRFARQAGTIQLQTAPTLPLMHAAFVLAGLGTFLLGPILPLLSANWHLSDSASGLLLLSQFLGATAGGVTVSARLRTGLATGLLCAFAGLLLFAFAQGLLLACAGLLLGGFGIGRLITTNNLIGGARYAQNRGEALTWLNLSFSFGALLSPLLALALTPHVALRSLLAGFAALFLAVAAALFFQFRGAPFETALAQSAEAPPGASLRTPVVLFFAAMILLYGGLETCFNSWLTTFATRDARSSLTQGQGTLVLFLLGLNVGRAFSGWLLKRMPDRTLQRAALVLSVLLGAVLVTVHQPTALAVLAILLGAALSPLFPVTFAIFLAHRPAARTAGIVLAASGIGAAAFGWAMGAVSTASGSLRSALSVPVVLAASMLALSLGQPVCEPESSMISDTPPSV
jgi:FHS family glucose/mannose:H+ symporter-like MFS transporter